MKPFLSAVQFLTRLPVPGATPGDLTAVAGAQAWFPAVGLLLGAALVGVDRIAMRALPPVAVDALVVVALIVLTGALHLDGLADAADGLFGGRDAEDRLRIMRDVHAGTYAIVAVFAVLLLKWSGLLSLPVNVRVEALLLFPCLARFSLLVAIAVFPYAREEGVGAGFRERAWPGATLAGGAFVLLVSVGMLGAGGALAFAFAIAAGLAAGAFATRLAGGMTGDVYGATVEVSEAAVVLFLAAMAERGWVDAWLLG
ncbi:MAG: adenosylcobinamide-GDP ribazoletransferase [Dehalococcoidia bacterium]